MDASSGGPTEHIIYWTRVGNMIPSSWREQKLAVAEQNLRGIIPDAILIRVSTIDNDDVAAISRIDDFIRTLLQSLSPSARSVLIL
jgi:EpsI family protein